MPNLLAVRMEEELRPVIGTVLATVSVDVEVKRIGKTLETVQPEDLDELANNLVSSLRLVVGQELAERAARSIRSLG
jgi:hypothetical protein